MKRMIMVFLIALALGFSSCQKDDEVVPGCGPIAVFDIEYNSTIDYSWYIVKVDMGGYFQDVAVTEYQWYTLNYGDTICWGY